MGDKEILAPFLQSRQSRHAYHDRTASLLSALAPSKDPFALISLPNEGDENESRPTSTFLIRSPTEEEHKTLLESCRCRLVDASVNLKLMYRVAGNGEGHHMAKWDMSSSLKSQVSNCAFGGEYVILGVLLDGPDSTASTRMDSSSMSLMSGVSDNGLVRNCIFEPGSSIHRNSEVSDTHVMKSASIVGCGAVTAAASDLAKSVKKCNFDMHAGSMDVEVGPEAGGARVVNVTVESTLVDVCHDLKMDTGGATIAPLVSSVFTDAPNKPNVSMNLLCPYSSLLHTPQVSHVHLLPHSSIHSAASVHAAILLPHAAIQKGCTTSHALLQWHATLTSHSDAHFVFLMERSEVGPHSFTANAIYGPDSHVSGGEVHCTVFGPNANAHHQSLMIGILWPLGRGNVGYGANVGSNHTGRIPDQETATGEGTFWGLGTVIKFPIDLTSSPYSIIAAGVQLPPQRITMPFSLITDGPGGMNQLTPGWLLHYSPYTIARSEVKFANRRTAKRHDFYTGWKILRGGIMDLCADARARLIYAGQSQPKQKAGETSGSKPKAFRGDKTIPGIGANQLTEKGRQIGIRAYTDAIQRYALRGLLDQLVALAKQSEKGLSFDQVITHIGLTGIASSDNSVLTEPSKPKVDWPILPWNEASHTNPDSLWKHQQSLLQKELPSILDKNNNDILGQLLNKCILLEEDHAKRVYKSKSRDDVRGSNTVPGYLEVRVSADKDSVVLAAKEEAEKVKEGVKLVQQALGKGGSDSRSRL